MRKKAQSEDELRTCVTRQRAPVRAASLELAADLMYLVQRRARNGKDDDVPDDLSTPQTLQNGVVLCSLSKCLQWGYNVPGR